MIYETNFSVIRRFSFLMSSPRKEWWSEKKRQWSVGRVRRSKFGKNAKFLIAGSVASHGGGQAHPTIECLDIIATVRPDTWLRTVPMWTQEEEVDRTVRQRFAVDRVSSAWTVRHISRIYQFDNFFFFILY